MSAKYKVLFGGTFNPVHVGHIRLGIEVLECAHLPYAIENIEIIPCATPVFKDPAGLLPFNLRLAMLEAAFADIPGFNVNAVEGQREGISYTYHTLRHYAEHFPQSRLLFVLGMENLCDLPNWYKSSELLGMADFGVVPRVDGDMECFLQVVRRQWPQAIIHEEQVVYASISHSPAQCTEQVGNVFFMPLPRMDISSTFVRERWLDRRQLEMLIPRQAHDILEQNRELVRRTWLHTTDI